MSNAAKDYLDDIRARKRALMDQLKELRELEKAIRAASAAGSTSSASDKVNDEPTLKEMIVSVLRALGRGADALEIIDEIKEAYGKSVKRTSLSPQLSRLKGDEKLVLDDKVWYLPEQYEEYKAKHRRDLISRHVDDEAAASASDSRFGAVSADELASAAAASVNAAMAAMGAQSTLTASVEKTDPWTRAVSKKWME